MLKMLFALILLVMICVPTNVSAQSRNVWIDGDHGRLAAIVQTPDGLSNFPLVIICHGFTAQKEHPLLTYLANYLEAEGIASIRFDFNGHGKSEGRFQDMTVLNEIEDAKKVYEYARDMRGVTGVSMAGHSQGGVVTSMVAGQLGAEEIQSIALMAPAAVLRDDAIRGNLFGVVFNSYDNIPEYVEVPGGHRVGREYIRTSRNLPIYETAANFEGPVFLIHGTNDIVVPYTYSLRYQEIYRGGAEIELLEGFDHSFTQDERLTARKVADFFARQLK